MEMPTIYGEFVYFTRACSYSASGADRYGTSSRNPLQDTDVQNYIDNDLIWDFENHSRQHNRLPTSLVSTSSRIIDTLQRAFNKHFKDEEPLSDIWILFIQVPPEVVQNEHNNQIRHAMRLAEDIGWPEEEVGKYRDFSFPPRRD
ncbi:hypothetical protein PpBr36_06810 [Pyricularia pennisetigena]|uniref:hypothetical protein n=1 Tax=Pyricularia pennisetigena TaxID=1578925 RepID=UPI0011545605|nr:hypothetical protein PpBr36_06810 [Pyricularia pennisetigena]TLS25376.1 hypothetical protein PpBr36_06810 [Pyricularia pennisetigena]